MRVQVLGCNARPGGHKLIIRGKNSINSLNRGDCSDRLYRYYNPIGFQNFHKTPKFKKRLDSVAKQRKAKRSLDLIKTYTTLGKIQ
jgi:hypothetical protein